MEKITFSILPALLLAPLAALQAADTGDILLFSFFRDNGQAGIYLATSDDGLHFTPLNNDQPVMKPAPWAGQHLTRDPSMVYHDGTFHAVWTTGWKGNCFGYAESKDLVHWSQPVQVTPFPADKIPGNTWAPEICWDPLQKNFAIFWSSSFGDGEGSHIFVTRTADGKTFSEAKLFLDPGFPCIDGMMVFDDNAADKRWVMVFKNEAPENNGGKNLHIATTPADFSQPWTIYPEPVIGPGTKVRPESMCEGPSLLKTETGWNLYWDSPLIKTNAMASSTDLTNWTDHTAELQLPENPRHGTVFRAPRSAVGWLNGAVTLEKKPTPSANLISATTENEHGLGTLTPTWSVTRANLIAGLMPSASAGKWENDRVGGLVKLTDGEICPVVSHGPVTAFATAGEAGQFAVYTLPPSAGGYDLTNITVYGGWGDPNRAEQCFDVSCATAENPDEFVQIAAVRFKPPMEPGQASLSRSVLAGSPGKPLAKHVTKVRFDFKPGAFGYVGYSEITIEGTPAQASGKVASVNGSAAPVVRQESVAKKPESASAGKNKSRSWTSDNGNGTFSNPLFYEDMPDPAMIRVGDDFYLTSTTFASMPGLPILHSKDLVNWELLGYAFDKLDLSPAMRLEENKNIYSQGIWAPSFCYNKGTFYILANVNGGYGTQVFRATDPRGPWKHNIIKTPLYDLGVLFDDDGRVYVVHGQFHIQISELNGELTEVLPGSTRQLFPRDKNMVEGSHFYKINGKYFIVGTTSGAFSELTCARAEKLEGPWESTVICKESMGIGRSRGDVNEGGGLTLHQGGIVDTPTGEWWSYIMTDHNGIGRLTCLAPVTWTDGWPMVGLPGNLTRTPRIWIKPNLPVQPIRSLTQRNDDFSAQKLSLVWEWNHVPDDTRWSLTERPGFLRLHALPATDLKMARNTLTQKAVGPESTVTVELDASGMKPGDVSGLSPFKFPYAWIGIAKTDAGFEVQHFDETTKAITRAPAESPRIWLRAHCNFDTDIGELSYSTNGSTFLPLGGAVDLTFNTRTFQGIRYSLFNFNTTGKIGGYVDFHRFAVDEPRPCGLTKPIPYGKTITLVSVDGSAALTVKDGTVKTTNSAVAATAFRVIDRGMGRIALAAPSGELISIGGKGKVGEVTLKNGTPGDAETFQWVDMQRGDLMLMSLATHRYLGTATDQPSALGPVSADHAGTRPDRLNGVCWIAEPATKMNGNIE